MTLWTSLRQYHRVNTRYLLVSSVLSMRIKHFAKLKGLEVLERSLVHD